jgi:Taurine catabolism dioxygenase TauD, TfdA family
MLRLLGGEPRAARDLLAQASAVLLRGFQIDIESEFGSVAKLVCGELSGATGRKFHESGVRYVRNCNPVFGRSWRDLYQTSNRLEVERLAAARKEHVRWSDDDHLRIEAVRPAFVRHDVSGKWVWFNQILHWHPACLAAPVRAMLEAKLGAENMPRNCSFGDGEPVPDDVVMQLIETYQRYETKFPWHEGDILVLDNLACAHAREPYAGRREHLVAMGEMGSFDER